MMVSTVDKHAYSTIRDFPVTFQDLLQHINVYTTQNAHDYLYSSINAISVKANSV